MLLLQGGQLITQSLQFGRIGFRIYFQLVKAVADPFNLHQQWFFGGVISRAEGFRSLEQHVFEQVGRPAGTAGFMNGTDPERNVGRKNR